MTRSRHYMHVDQRDWGAPKRADYRQGGVARGRFWVRLNGTEPYLNVERVCSDAFLDQRASGYENCDSGDADGGILSVRQAAV